MLEAAVTEPGHKAVGPANDEITLLGIATMLLRGRRRILVLASAGIAIGLGTALLRPRVYVSSATFIPEEFEQSSGLAKAASQFGISIPGSGRGWGPSVYVELLKSRALLEPLARDTVTLPEEGGKRVSPMDLFDINAPTLARRIDLTVRALRKRVSVAEEKTLGGVRVEATTQWPSVSLMLADRLVRGVSLFNVERRRSQAAAERQFVDGLAAEAERALRVAEDGLQSFLQRNRGIGNSPQLVLERDRLERQVSLRQQMYTALLQSREDARIREVRDTPVITVLEEPRLAVAAEPRNFVRNALIGGLGGALLGALITFLTHGLVGARVSSNREEREFFEVLAAATPRFGRRAGSRDRNKMSATARDPE